MGCKDCNNKSVGLGDSIAKAISKVSFNKIQPCEGCKNEKTFLTVLFLTAIAKVKFKCLLTILKKLLTMMMLPINRGWQCFYTCTTLRSGSMDYNSQKFNASFLACSCYLIKRLTLQLDQ